MEALPKTVTDEIRSILERIKSGELEHVQEDLHCGTAHCLAGWKQVLDLMPGMVGKFFTDVDICELGLTSKLKGKPVSAWYYAKEEWTLTYKESLLLFAESVTLDSQFDCLRLLELGYRFEEIQRS